MAKKKRIDPIKQREKRAKIAAGLGAVLLIGIGFVEVPSIMKQLNPKPLVSSPAPVGGTPGPGGSPTLPQIGGTPALATSSSGLRDTDVPPTASGNGQLVTFDAFEMKNPFKPQVSTAPVDPNPPDPNPAAPGATTQAADVPAAGATASPDSTSSTPATPLSILDSATGLTPPVVTAPATTGGTVPATTTPTAATTPTVAISVNGDVSKVGTQGTFPAGAPVFTLVSWQHGSAKISIVGGSYAAGGATLTLRLNTPVTLQNTHDGKQYKLVLLSTP
jgi:hypothetical protein